MRALRRVDEISFHFDKVRKGEMIQIGQICLLPKANYDSTTIMERVEVKEVGVDLDVDMTKVETRITKVSKERSKSDSGSDRERADKISLNLEQNNLVHYNSRKSDNRSFSNHSGGSYKAQYQNTSKFGDQRSTVVVQSKAYDFGHDTSLDEFRRSTFNHDKQYALGTS